jgi:hypothetical protein
MATYISAVVLTPSRAAAQSLARWPGSLFTLASTMYDIGSRGGWVYGGSPILGYAVGSLVGRLDATLTVAWNVHPFDPVRKWVTRVFDGTDEPTLIRALRGTFDPPPCVDTSQPRSAHALTPEPTTWRSSAPGTVRLQPAERVFHKAERRDDVIHPDGVFPIPPGARRAVRGTAGTLYTLIKDEAAAAGVPPALALAVADEESRFDPDAVSNKGAKGVMQLMPVMIQRMGVTDPFDARQNVHAGVRILATYIKRYNGNLADVLTAYRSGAGNLAFRGPNDHDRQYIARVREKTELYTRVLNQGLISEGP